MKKIRLWIKVRWIWLLSFGKCRKCGNKLHLNKLGFYNCGECFGKFIEN